MARAPRKSGGRSGSGDDSDLWQRVARTVTPLPATTERLKDMERRRAEADRPAPTVEAAPPSAPDMGGKRKGKAGTRTSVKIGSQVPPPVAPTHMPRTDPQATAARGRVAGLDRRTAERLRKGVFQIDARLDLHGLNREQAHAVLRQRVRACHAAGQRCLLVITGKGSRGRQEADDMVFGAEPPGRLKREVPGWLAGGDLAPLVLSTAPAVPRDGGSGALYVLLRRRRDGAG